MMYEILDSFQGKYRFLSNFFPCKITHEEFYSEPDPFSGSVMKTEILEFENTEQFFHYGKAKYFGDYNMALKILKTPDPKENKKLGRKVKGFDPIVWIPQGIKVMNQGLVYKFTQNIDLKQKLLDTYPKILVEGNTWGDYTWGMVNGEGKNWLGILLMKLRNQLIEAV